MCNSQVDNKLNNDYANVNILLKLLLQTMLTAIWFTLYTNIEKP